MEQAELAALCARAEAALTRIPGVLGVGYALKEVAGQVTRQPSLQVYVAEKKAPGDIPPEEMIPATFEGIPTDVRVAPTIVSEPCADEAQHSPLIGGISITNFKLDGGGGISTGTLGFFATLDGAAGPDNVVLVSNSHVLMANGAAVGDTVYQPPWNTAVPAQPILGKGPIGKIHGAAKQGLYKFTYPGESELEYYIDCAMAKLDICVSSWCNTNCGVSYKNLIRDLAISGNSKVEGIARVVQIDVDSGVYTVYKVGRTTSRTVGLVTGINITGAGGKKGLIQVDVVGTDCEGNVQFSDVGDSGSALINSQNKLVGIHFGKDGSIGSRSYSCQIHPVMKFLGITPISTANPPVGPAGQARADIEGVFDGINQTIPLRERMLATPAGTAIHDRVLAHRAEVVGLVNHRRAVTVAWHRAKGPAFLAHAIANVRDPAHLIPREIEGVTRAELLRRMADVLSQHGSPELAAAIAGWRDFVLSHLDITDDLHGLVDRLEKTGAPGSPVVTPANSETVDG